MTAPTDRTVEPDDRLDRHLLAVCGVILLGSFTSLLDTTIVSVAFPTFADRFRADLASVQWVGTAYLLALGAVIPLTGWVVRRLGVRSAWLLSVALFTGGSLLCGLAWSAPSLILFRVLQGLGGGMVLPIGQAFLAGAAGPRRMSRVMSLVGIPAQLSPILGPVLGGVLVDGPGWRWLFLLNVPVGALALVLSLRVLPAGRPEPGHRLDVLGLALLSPGLALVLYGLSEVARDDRAGGAVVMLALGVLLLAAFVAHALRTRYRPLVDLRLLARRSFAAPTAVMFFFGFGYFGPMFLLPIYFQDVRGSSALAAGLLLAPQGVGALTVLLVTARMSVRLAPRTAVLAGMAIMLVATIPLTQLATDTDAVLLGVALAVRGVGIGLAVVPIMVAAYAGLDPAAIPEATSMVTAVQRIGGSFGTAVLAVVLQQRLSGTPADPAGAFGTAFWWTVSLGSLALLPALLIPLARSPGSRRSGP